MLRRAVSCFLDQSYQPRELVILYQTDDHATIDYLSKLDEPSVRAVEVAHSPRLSTGSLRNIALQAARGHYVAMWDDDDWHGPTRLAEQIGCLAQTGRAGCVLRRLVLYDGVTQSAYLSAVRGWEGSLVAERAAVPLFPDLRRGEDTAVLIRMANEKMLVALDRPALYIYVYHGGNTCNRAHWRRYLLPSATLLPSDESDRIRSLLTRGRE